MYVNVVSKNEYLGRFENISDIIYNVVGYK